MESPAKDIKIEFQGGEPLLNFGLIQFIVREAKGMAAAAGKRVSFVITTNLALIDDDILGFCKDHGILLSTSLDGPADLHNAKRLRRGNNSHEEIGRAHVWTTVTNSQLVCSILLQKKNRPTIYE